MGCVHALSVVGGKGGAGGEPCGVKHQSPILVPTAHSNLRDHYISATHDKKPVGSKRCSLLHTSQRIFVCIVACASPWVAQCGTLDTRPASSASLPPPPHRPKCSPPAADDGSSACRIYMHLPGFPKRPEPGDSVTRFLPRSCLILRRKHGRWHHRRDPRRDYRNRENFQRETFAEPWG